MPIKVADKLPATKQLRAENIFVMSETKAMHQDIRPLKIAIVNLMPTKIATETQLARVLANSPLQVEMTLVQMDSHEATHISQEHMDAFYKTLDEIKDDYFDGLILTGAPVEQMPFEEVDYWPELCDIFEWSKTHVYSSMFICWGAQAALYYFHGVHKRLLDEKVFGVFEHDVIRPYNPLMRGFDPVFYAPHSRHTEIDRLEVLEREELRIIAESLLKMMEWALKRHVFHDYSRGSTA